ncbi:radical SAM/SPASM domain-containing protein [Flavivirga eckloniae]|uniref:Radical SAM core domain-containing protein n=1 Tax=Flavivirga eckloniae TaxID=1803846 RepID=A0A2K9PWE9_9FLAO|nr:radical SAM protein [Flavivirga eckloniae]AUP81389.1 hypothetical protein C1H87_22790 [Flavivirga eckloniae]
MKASRYNVFYPKADKIIGYNSISDNFIVLEPILHELFEASINENLIDELKNVHLDLYDILIDKGFVINENINELEVIKGISDKTDYNDATYELIINPTMNCNFKCWYCYETHIKDSKMNSATLEKVVKFVDNVLEGKKGKLKNFTLEWFGGEPLLYFEKTVLPILKEVYPKMLANNINFRSGFTSNGLLINQDVIEKCKKYGVENFQITLDGHRERHNQVRFVSKQRGSYDEIIANIKLCLQNKLKVITRINVSDETISDLLKVIGDFKDISPKDKKYLIFSFHEVWQEEKDLTADISGIVEEFRRNNLRCAYIGERNASITSSCYADKLNHATINYNGDVFKCTARDFETKSREGVLQDTGIIEWNEKFQKRVYDTRFKNKPCLECKILPICNGGCSQHRIENENEDYCIYGFNEDHKLNIIKEKFSSRLVDSMPSEHYDVTINKLLSINFNAFKVNEPQIYQETFKQFFSEEVSTENFAIVNEINDIYVNLITSLRKMQLSTYQDKHADIEKKLAASKLNDNEVKVIDMSSLPLKAYYYYKIEDYEQALYLTNGSILNDDFFLEKYPFLYGHKVQQIHNIIRIYFKQEKFKEACLLNNDILNHLILGNKVTYEVGYWYDSYKIENSPEMINMIYQIFSETLSVITNLSNNGEKERELFQTAFKGLIACPDIESLDENLLPLLIFVKIKAQLFENPDINKVREELDSLIDVSLNSEYSFFMKSLFYSLFVTLGINGHQDNKREFMRVHAT